MPWLNGNSIHGSKPITWLSLTLSWMPHCWPQKQQCVCTTRSGSTLLARRAPSEYARCGPNWWMIWRGSTACVAMMSTHKKGSRAIHLVGQCLAPHLALGEAKQDAAAARADPLVVLDLRVGHLVLVAEPLLDCNQILDVHARGVGLAAAPAVGLLALGADLFVETDAELGGPLEDVKEL